MARTSRSNDWGFPRWRSYGGERGATQVRLCDREGCSEAGDRPAPKAPNSPERWYFCESHARSEEHTSELQSLMRISYAVFCLKKKKNTTTTFNIRHNKQ